MIRLLRDRTELGDLADRVMRADRVGIDTETFDEGDRKIGDHGRNLMPWNGAQMSGLSVAIDEGTGYYIPVQHRLGRQADPAGIEGLLDALSRTPARHVMHNAQFDWAILERSGRGFTHRWNTYDTATAAWLEDENRPKGLKTLSDLYLGGDSRAEQKALAELRKRPNQTEMYRRLRAEYPDMPAAWSRAKARSASKDLSWGDLYPEEMAPYAGTDPVDTLKLQTYQGARWTPALRREMQVQECLYRMRRRGVLVDPERLQTAGYEYRAIVEAIQEKYPDHDLSKPVEVRALLYDVHGLPVIETTDKGVPSTAKAALEQMEGHPVAEDILSYRGAAKALNSYVGPLFEYASTSVDGRVHPSFNPVGTVTGRRSSSMPNLHQIPKGSTLPGVRESFRAAPGLEIWEWDLASAELWIMAALSGDPVMTAILQEGRNMHEEMAFDLFGTKDHASRYYTLAKNVDYGIPYGAGIDQMTRFAAKAGIPQEQARAMATKVRDGHRSMFPTYHAWSKRVGKEARRRGYAQLPWPGRRRHVNSRFGRVPEYAVANSLIQGAVAEVMKDVMIEAEQALDGLVLEVHDAFMFEIEPGYHEVVEATLGRILADVNPYSLPLRFEGKQWQ
jgi:DNA polymerase-1